MKTNKFIKCIDYQYHKYFQHHLLQKHKKVILYLIFGCTAAFTDLSIYLFLFNIVHVEAIISTVVSISVATIVGFILNAIINFQVDNRFLLRFISYASVSAVGMIISSVMLCIFHDLQGFDGNIVKIVSFPVIFLVQYFLNSKISFRKMQKTQLENEKSNNEYKEISKMSCKKHIAIIGGGYTGLTTAYRLSKAGYKVTIYEKESFVGGLASGFTMDKLPLERIWHFIYMTDNDALSLADELGVRDKLVFHDSSVATYYDGKLYPFMSPVDLLRFTPLSFLNRIRTGVVGLYLQHIKNWQPLTRITAYEWMKAKAGEQATEIIWKPLLEGKFGKYYDKVIMSWLWGRIKVRVDSKETSREKLGYFTGSFDILTQRLVDEITKNGGEIITDTAVEKINKMPGDRVALKFKDSLDIFDSVIVTTPTHVFAKLIGDNEEVTKEHKQELKSISYIGALVMVFTSNQEISPYYWHNINDPKIPFLVFLSNTVLAGKETYQEKNVYYVGFYAEHSHHYFSDDDESIMKEWEDGIKKMFPDFDVNKIREKKLFKFKNAQHIVDLDYDKKIPSYESIVKNVYLANFSQIYPDDRGLNYAIQEGNKIAEMIKMNLGG